MKRALAQTDDINPVFPNCRRAAAP